MEDDWFKRRAFYRETFALMSRQVDTRGYRTALDMVAKGLSKKIPKEERIQRASLMLDRVDLTKRASHRPFQLSGGELRRVALARALAKQSPIVLAEEPTGQVDPVTARSLLELMREINSQSGTTFVIVTDSEQLAREATRTIRLEEGRITYDHARTFTLWDGMRMASGAADRRLRLLYLCSDGQMSGSEEDGGGVPTLGDTLRAARARKKAKLSQVAAETKIPWNVWKRWSLTGSTNCPTTCTPRGRSEITRYGWTSIRMKCIRCIARHDLPRLRPGRSRK